VVAASNFSEGVALLRALVTTAARQLDGWDVEIVETHHQGKRDAPSGTAEALLDDLVRARAVSTVQHGRVGAVGPREPNEIGVHSVRAGTVHGVHDVLFAGSGEELSLKHTATSRDVFVLGALKAARWIVSQQKGRYDMPDVLGL
jgi:4-hydroxy-tetrahydrodipicolinate reductase